MNRRLRCCFSAHTSGHIRPASPTEKLAPRLVVGDVALPVRVSEQDVRTLVKSQGTALYSVNEVSTVATLRRGTAKQRNKLHTKWRLSGTFQQLPDPATGTNRTTDTLP